MTQGTDLKPPKSPIRRKLYGLSTENKFSGMGTVPYFGKGEQLVENMQIESGYYRKMYGDSLFTTVSISGIDINDILYLWGYEKGDGTFQMLCIVKTDTSKWKMRIIKSNGTIDVPTGGAGDVEFTSETFSYVQLGLFGYISNKSSTTNLYSWDGTALTLVSNAPQNIDWICADGQRIIASASGVVYFSGRNYGVISDFTAGTGVDQDGNYNVGNPGLQVGGIRSGNGVVVFYQKGAELHKVLSNNAGDGLLGDTKIPNWNYNGAGVLNQRQIINTENFIYIINPDGIIKISSLNGESLNIIEGRGAIQNFWKTLDITSMVIEYDSKNSMLVVACKKSGNATNNMLLCYHEHYDAFYIKTNVFAKSLCFINKQLYCGNEGSGKIIKIFDEETFLDSDGAQRKSRIITEWDSLNTPFQEKRLMLYSVFGNMSPNSETTVNIYKDGSIATIDGVTITQSDLTNSSTTSGIWGDYLSGVGTPDEDSNSDFVKSKYFTTNFGTLCIEIEETSPYNFIIYMLLLQFSPVLTSDGGKVFLQNSYANSLF